MTGDGGPETSRPRNQGLSTSQEEIESSPRYEEDKNHSHSNNAYAVDEIGVTLDYQPPDRDMADYEVAFENRSQSSPTSTPRFGRRYESSIGRHEQRHRANTFRDFVCTKKWIGHFISGLFTGAVFLAIGIVFVVYFNQLPKFVGALFILVSIPPCCISLNKLYTSRRNFRFQQELSERRANLRRTQERRDEDASYRGVNLPLSDLPPSYSNLGFEDPAGSNGEDRNVSASSSTEPDLPSYDDVISPKKLQRHDPDVPQ